MHKAGKAGEGAFAGPTPFRLPLPTPSPAAPEARRHGDPRHESVLGARAHATPGVPRGIPPQQFICREMGRPRTEGRSVVPEWVHERGWHPPHLVTCWLIEAMGSLGQLVRARQWGKAISTQEGLSWNHPCPAVTQTSARLPKGVGVDGCPQSQPHRQKDMEMLQTNPSSGGSAVPSLSKRDSNLAGGRQGTCMPTLTRWPWTFPGR